MSADVVANADLPVVLIHAFPLDAQLWAPVKDVLDSRGLNVITPELPGYGQRSLEELPAEESLSFFVEDLISELDRQEIDRFVLGGLSLGGYVTLAALEDYSDRIAGLILADTRATVDAEDLRAGRLAFADHVDAEGIGWVPDAMIGGLLAQITRDDRPEIVALTRALIEAANPATVSWTQRAMAARADTRGVLAAFDGPTLVILGEGDVMTPREQADLMIEAAQQGTFAAIPDAGHLSAIEQPEVVASAIEDWLRL